MMPKPMQIFPGIDCTSRELSIKIFKIRTFWRSKEFLPPHVPLCCRKINFAGRVTSVHRTRIRIGMRCRWVRLYVGSKLWGVNLSRGGVGRGQNEGDDVANSRHIFAGRSSLTRDHAFFVLKQHRRRPRSLFPL